MCSRVMVLANVRRKVLVKNNVKIMVVYRLMEKFTTYLQINIPFLYFAQMFFRVYRTNLAQETIEQSRASCPYDHALFLVIRVICEFRILAQEGRRDFLDTPKCSQWPCLYTTYEATYARKCLFLEIFSKN